MAGRGATGEAARGIAAQAAPIAAITIFGVAMAMSYPLFALVLERAGASGTLIGLNATAGAATMVLGAPLLPRLMQRVGLGALTLGAGVLLALSMLAIPLGEGFLYWTLVRILSGFAATAVFFAAEYWIVATAPAMGRGRIVAVYALFVSAGFAAGPALLGVTGLRGLTPYVAAAAVCLVGLAPVLWGLSSAPKIDAREPRPGPLAALALFLSDPAPIFAVVVFGSIEFGAMALIAVWGVRSGLGEAEAALLLTAIAVGAMALQMPLGWAADRCDRRRVLLVCALGSVIAPVGLLLVPTHSPLVALLAALWGAASVGLYSVPLTELGARYRGARLAVANAAIVLAYGIGALVSPALFGWAMEWLEPDGLLVASAGVTGAYVVLLLARMARAAR